MAGWGVVPMVGNGTGTRLGIAFVAAFCLCLALGPMSAWSLPTGRLYEQVTPAFKGGYGAKAINAINPDGEGVIYSSQGTFVGTSSASLEHYYQAVRGGSGWASISLNPQAQLSPRPGPDGFSSSLGASLWDLPLHSTNIALANDISPEEQFFLEVAGELHKVGPVLKSLSGEEFTFASEGISDDFCHVVIKAPALLAEAVGEEGPKEQLYDVDTCATDEPAISLVGMTNSGGLLAPECGPIVGNGDNRTNAVSADGNTVFFLANMPNDSKCKFVGSQLFARVGGTKTLEVSKPLAEACADVPCPGAGTRATVSFRGASEDGSRVFFTTAAPLEPATDKDNTNDLYLAVIGCPVAGEECESWQRVVTSLVQVSHDPNPAEAAEVQDVVALSHDGSRVYFVARGVLSGEGPTAEGEQSSPVLGADNLYSYVRDAQYPEGHTVFVADLCSAPGLSGKAVDLRCPGDLEGENSSARPRRNDIGLFGYAPLAQVAGAEGGILIFSTYARLIDGGPEADTDDAQDVYRLNMTTDALQRVSIGEEGSDANGNREDTERVSSKSGEFANMYNGDARIQPPLTGRPSDERKLVTQAADGEGSRIVFTASDPLSPSASNGQPDIYEWHDGSVSLLSTGSSAEPDESPVITPSGRDVFFVSSQGLVAQDTDGVPDIYDAAIGSVPPQVPTQPAPCAGDACQGPLTNPAPLLVPGSVSQVPEANLSPPSKKAVKKKSAKKKPAKKKSARKKAKAKKKLRAKRSERKGGGTR